MKVMTLICPACDGSGEIHVTGFSVSPFSGGSGPDPRCWTVEVCDRCHGRGVVDEFEEAA